MPALDPERFASLRRDFPGTDLRELLRSFLELTAPTVDELETRIAAGDAEGSRDAAHRLRGGCLAIGALELADTAGQIETRVLEGTLDERTRALVARARAEWTALLAEIEKLPD